MIIRLMLCLILLISPPAIGAIRHPVNLLVSSPPASSSGAFEAEHQQRLEAEFSSAIATAKLQISQDENSRLQTWIGFYGIFIAIILAIAGGITWRTAAQQAAIAATGALKKQRDELDNIRKEASVLRDEIEGLRDETRGHRDAAKGMTDELKRALAIPPGTGGNDLSETVRIEAEKIADVASAKPAQQRSVSELRTLIFVAIQKKDWKESISHLREMLNRPDLNKDELKFAKFNIAFALQELAVSLRDEDVDHLYDEAVRHYREILDVTPGMTEALNNLGNALSWQANKKTGKEADELFSEAEHKYQEALAIRPDRYTTFCNWGNALFDQAQSKPASDADQYYVEACNKFNSAVKINPDFAPGLDRYGLALHARAQLKQGEEAESLYAEAYQKFAMALDIDPTNHGFLNNWGNALISHASRRSGDDVESMYAAAEEKFSAAEAILLGSASYNLACLAARRGDAPQAARWLVAAHRHKANWPGCTHLSGDQDFDCVIRAAPEFVAALAEIGCSTTPP